MDRNDRPELLANTIQLASQLDQLIRLAFNSRDLSGGLRKRMIPKEDDLPALTDHDLQRTHRRLLRTIQAPWFPVLSQFELAVPDTLFIRGIDEMAVLPHVMAERQGLEGEALEKAHARTHSALVSRMTGRIDMAIRQHELNGHCVVPAQVVFEHVLADIEEEARFVRHLGQQENEQVSLLGALRRTEAEPLDYGLDGAPDTPEGKAKIKALFLEALKTAPEQLRLKLKKINGAPGVQRGRTALAEGVVRDFFAKRGEQQAERQYRKLRARMTKIRTAIDRDEMLTAEQKRAIRPLIESGAGILTGGPGTGKTHTVARLVSAAMTADLSVQLGGPTGKSCARMNGLVKTLSLAEGEGKGSTASGKPLKSPQARTIHGLLQAHRGDLEDFIFPSDANVDADVLIVDESSMIDIHLMGRLIGAIDPTKTAVLFVGDPDQIPPVGPGAPFADIVTALVDAGDDRGRLKTVHRQKAGSPVIDLAAAIRDGEPIGVQKRSGPDLTSHLHFVPARKGVQRTPLDASDIVEIVRESCANNGLDPASDVMIVAPQYDGDLGVNQINHAIKEAFNPAHGEDSLRTSSGRIVSPGDRVILSGRNLVSAGLMNGDCGVLVGLNVDRGEDNCAAINVGSNGQNDYRYITMREAMALDLGYAITAHRAQGDESKLVVFIGEGRNRSMLDRNLIYTSITRSTEHLVIVGHAAFLERACLTPPPERLRTLASDLEKAIAKSHAKPGYTPTIPVHRAATSEPAPAPAM